MSKLRILYVSSEITPFLDPTNLSEYVRQLPEAMQDRGMEIRILVPKFGCINERKNRLHEVVRLSGINISVGDEERPLLIKVASIPSAKLQVYFIDNDDYFHRKSTTVDKDNKFHEDNDERAVFFCKGVLETVKKLGWSPDIVHVNDWMSSLIPMYLKTHYKKEPIYKNTRSVFSVFDTPFSHKFDKLAYKAKMHDISEESLEFLKTNDYEAFIRTGIEYADHVFKAEENYSPMYDKIFDDYASKKTIEYVPAEDNHEYYYNFYNELAGVNELVAG
ncbi:MAG: glycogen/starch synthase [Bacteroidota bacterium]|nr:glycogen/starch synthase [Bacteroidota bacterium]